MTLTRLTPDDGAGIVGAMLMTHFRFDEESKPERNHELEKPTVGWHIQLDSLTHWYHTSLIEEIISKESTEEYEEVIFRTQNSKYQWRASK